MYTKPQEHQPAQPERFNKRSYVLNGLQYNEYTDSKNRLYVDVSETRELKIKNFTSRLQKIGLGKYAEMDLKDLFPIKALAGKTPLEIYHHMSRNQKNLFLNGAPGTGKTTLTIALAKHALENNIKPYVVRWTNMLSKIKGGFHNGERDNIFEHINKTQLLVLDELGMDRKRAATDFEAETLFDIVTARYGNRAPWIITTNLSFEHLEKLYGRSIMDRIRDKQSTLELNFASEKAYRL